MVLFEYDNCAINGDLQNRHVSQENDMTIDFLKLKLCNMKSPYKEYMREVSCGR